MSKAFTHAVGISNFFFNWDSLHARLNSTNRLEHTGNLFRKNLQLKVSVNSRLKTI